MRRTLFVWILVAGTAGIANAQEAFTVRYGYPEGKRLIYDMKASSSILTNGAKLRQEWKSVESGLPQNDGSTDVSLKIEGLEESEFVSSKNIIRQILSCVANDTIRFRLSGTGDVSDLSGPRMDRLPIQDRQTTEAALLQLLTHYSLSFPKLPSGEISAKDGWESTKRVTYKSGILDLEDVHTSTFKIKKTSKKDGNACLEVEEKTSIDVKGYLVFGQGSDSQALTPRNLGQQPGGSQVIVFRTLGKGTRQGKLLIDTERGLVLEYEADTDFEVKFGPAGGPEPEMTESKASLKLGRKLKGIEGI